MRWRPRSLFWTFAGAFLAVVAVAAVVQGWVLGALASRLAQEQAASASHRPALEASLDLSRAEPAPPRQLERILHSHQPPDGAFFLAYVRDDGQILLPWPVEREARHRLARWLTTGVDSWQIDERWDAAFRHVPVDDQGGRRPGTAPPPRRPDGNRAGDPKPPRRDGRPPHRDDQRPPRRDVQPPRPGEPFRPGQPDPRPRRRAQDFPPLGNLRQVAEIAVVQGGEPLGRIVAVHPVQGAGFSLRSVDAGPALLLLPTALVLAAVAGLAIIRLLTGRLRRLEALAERIASGDLAARIPEPGDDEIGRLGRELNRMASSLQSARAELEASTDQRRRLLADISHELATPLTSIRGYAETLLDAGVPTTPEERSQYLEHVLDEARRLELLIGDLFELSRLESGIGDFVPERLDLASLCEHTAERFRGRFEDAGLDLRFERSEPIWIEADGRRMEQVLENLLTNALRYVPATGSDGSDGRRDDGGGEVVVRSVRDGDQAVLEVSDDGPGFSRQDLVHVFDRFYRSEANAQVAGSGLGLAIVQEIVERHGGRVEAANRASAEDGASGAVLRVVLPFRSPFHATSEAYRDR